MPRMSFLCSRSCKPFPSRQQFWLVFVNLLEKTREGFPAPSFPSSPALSSWKETLAGPSYLSSDSTLTREAQAGRGGAWEWQPRATMVLGDQPFKIIWGAREKYRFLGP